MATTRQGEILDYQVELLDYLYDLPLANDSLFVAEVSSPSDSLATSKFRISKITFTPPRIEYEMDQQRRTSLIKSITRNDTVTIDWIEDAYNSIEKWTLALMSKQIDFSTGLYKVGGSPLIYDLKCIRFAYKEGNTDTSNPFDSIAIPQPTGILTFTELKPEGISDITMDSGAGGNVKTVSVTYHVKDAVYENDGSERTFYHDDGFWGLAKSLKLL